MGIEFFKCFKEFFLFLFIHDIVFLEICIVGRKRVVRNDISSKPRPILRGSPHDRGCPLRRWRCGQKKHGFIFESFLVVVRFISQPTEPIEKIFEDSCEGEVIFCERYDVCVVSFKQLVKFLHQIWNPFGSMLRREDWVDDVILEINYCNLCIFK